MSKNPAKRGKQKGAVHHAEGEHGARTHRAIIEQLERGGGQPREEADAPSNPMHREAGKHHPFEDRAQRHDAAQSARRRG